MMTNSKLNHWKKYCCEPLELVDNYAAAKADNFAGWCIHHRLEIQQDGTRVSAKELIDQNLYYGRPASELVFMRFGEHSSLHHKDKVISAKTRQKLSESRKGEKNPFFGKHLSAETRLKLSESLKGKHLSAETRLKIAETLKGRTLSAETRQKMSEARKGKHRSEDHCKKIAEARKGKHWWNNGISNKCSRECPGEGWTRGRLAFKFKYFT